MRESGLGATAFVPGRRPTWEGWEDAAVHPERLGGYLREFRALLERYGYTGALYGHFGQGCVHTRIDFDFRTEEGRRRFRAFIEEAADLVVRFGGSLSGEHGDGQARGVLLEKMYGPELVQAFREFKALWDPAGRMNPGKVVDAREPDQDLRLGRSYRRPRLRTAFQYPGDEGGFNDAVLRCVGVGECRKTEEGVMCPSYMATREEKHSTRGRARLLFEMLQGSPLRRGWRSPEVKEALDLCLACKACKTECPVNVDMATYKAEFFHHYYRGRLRPRAAYAMGLVPWWCRLASLAPGLANRLAAAPVLSRALKALGGIAPQRELPRFAPRTFRSEFLSAPREAAGERVVLWPDTFTNHFEPGIAHAAVEVLEAAGLSVELPPRVLCCGRPLYDFGMLGLARRLLERTMTGLAGAIEAGSPVVVLEPSCAAVFKDELPNLFPRDERAKRLSRQVVLFDDFMAGRLDALGFPGLSARALVQGHCHQRAVFGLQGLERSLAGAGVDFRVLDSGCCGMAGSFGFEAGERYEVSKACGERVLLPAVREADAGTLLVADGFSCREQIRQATGRRALHLAEVLRLALTGSG